MHANDYMFRLTCNQIVGDGFGLTLEYITNEAFYHRFPTNESKVFGILCALYATRHVFDLFVKQNLLPVRAYQSQICSTHLPSVRTDRIISKRNIVIERRTSLTHIFLPEIA